MERSKDSHTFSIPNFFREWGHVDWRLTFGWRLSIECSYFAKSSLHPFFYSRGVCWASWMLCEQSLLSQAPKFHHGGYSFHPRGCQSYPWCCWSRHTSKSICGFSVLHAQSMLWVSHRIFLMLTRSRLDPVFLHQLLMHTERRCNYPQWLRCPGTPI